jgi:hypothetical protein
MAVAATSESPERPAVLGRAEQRLFIDGEWVAAASGESAGGSREPPKVTDGADTRRLGGLTAFRALLASSASGSTILVSQKDIAML